MSDEPKVCTEHVQDGEGGPDCDICDFIAFRRRCTIPATRAWIAKHIKRKAERP